MLKHLIIVGLAVFSLAIVAIGLQAARTLDTAPPQSAAAKLTVLAQYNPCPNMRCR